MAKNKRKTKEALKWIVQILHKHEIQFQIAGGLAVKIYGSKRELNDIDIDAPDNRINTIVPEVKKYITFGPKRYVGEGFDIFTLTLKYKGEIIDITGCDTGKLFDSSKKKWINDKVDLSKSVKRKVFGLAVPIIPKKDLIGYKKKMMRKVDKLDLKDLEK